MYKESRLLYIFILLLNTLYTHSQNIADEDIWKNISSVDEIIGEWETTFYSNDVGIPGPIVIGFIYTVSISIDNNNVAYDTKANYEPLIDYMVSKIDNDKITKDIFWDLLYENDKENLKDYLRGKYFFRKINISQLETINYKKYFINQFGNKLKYFSDSYESIINRSEIVLHKK
jgi:hypothetical protein